MDTESTLVTILRVMPTWVELLSLMLCTGALVGRLWLLPCAAAKAVAAAGTNRKILRKLFLLGIAGSFAAGAVSLVTKASEMGGTSVTDLFPLLPTVVLRTHFGNLWLAHMIGLGAMWGLAMFADKGWEQRRVPLSLLAIGALCCMAQSATGHAADRGDFSVAEAVDWLHLVAVLVWGGGVMVLAVGILPEARKALGVEERIFFAEGVSLFSSIAGWAVAVIALSAIYNVQLNVATLAGMTTTYGVIVAGKILLFLGVLELGAQNRYLNVPLLRLSAGSPGNGGWIGRLVARAAADSFKGAEYRSVLVRLLATVRLEALLVFFTLLLASLLRHEMPARHNSHHHQAHNHGNHPSL